MIVTTVFWGLLVVSFFTTSYCQQVEVPLTTKKGPILGLRFDPNTATGVSYDAFLGIPYGQKPARFQLAVARSSWTDVLSTKSDGAVCPQPGVIFSEDCLYLNVFTPVNAASTPKAYPVIVYIHGGAFTYGSSSSKVFGPDFLVNSGVILVTMNYRLGAAGFLTLGSKVAPGNLGLHDTLLALQWVQDEISTFGGDPKQVTLAGQSSGSVMTQMHYLSPLSTGMFKGVIAESGSALADWGLYSKTEGARRAKLLAKAVNCDTTKNDSAILSCLQNADINYIVGNETSGVLLSDDYVATGSYLRFVAVLDSSFTADHPFFNYSLDVLMSQALNRSKPMITGFNTDEGILKFVDNSWMLVEGNLGAFIPNRGLSEEHKTTLTNTIKSRYFNQTLDQNKVKDLVTIYTDYMWAYPSIQMTRYFANLTYGYLFAYEGSWAPTPSYFSKYQMKGVGHGDELNYLFYTAAGSQDMSTCTPNLANVNMKDQMVQWWTTFARTGTPDSRWETVSKGGYLVIDSALSSVNVTHFESLYYDFWANMTRAFNSATSTTTTHTSLFVVSFTIVAMFFSR